MSVALDQIKLASTQTKEAAEISKNNAGESKEAANIILNIAKEMGAYINKLKEISLKMAKNSQ